MKNLMRTLTLSAAALAALVAAPKSSAAEFRRGGARQMRPFRGETFRGREFRGREFRGGEFRGRELSGHEFRERAFVRPPAFFSGRSYVTPFRVYAGSRFYSTRPGPGYLYMSDLGWVFPPFPGAVWVPAHYDFEGFFIEGGWQ
jgi:hypothetical protein